MTLIFGMGVDLDLGRTGDSTGTMDHRYDEPYMLTETILCDTISRGCGRSAFIHEKKKQPLKHAYHEC